MRKYVIPIGVVAFFGIGAIMMERTNQRQQLLQQNTQNKEMVTQDIREERPPVRGYDFQNGGGYIEYSDTEIKMMRELQSYKSDGRYIYTPGRYIKSDEEKIRDYIEEHIDEILDEYGGR